MKFEVICTLVKIAGFGRKIKFKNSKFKRNYSSYIALNIIQRIVSEENVSVNQRLMKRKLHGKEPKSLRKKER